MGKNVNKCRVSVKHYCFQQRVSMLARASMTICQHDSPTTCQCNTTPACSNAICNCQPCCQTQHTSINHQVRHIQDLTFKHQTPWTHHGKQLNCANAPMTQLNLQHAKPSGHIVRRLKWNNNVKRPALKNQEAGNTKSTRRMVNVCFC